jgi:hypothetical protein
LSGEDLSHRDSILVRIARRRRQRPPRLSTILRQLGDSREASFSVAQLADIFKDRVFGALLFLFAVPNVFPLPPGSSSVLGAPLILVARPN